MKHLLLIISLLFSIATCTDLHAQRVNLRTNLLLWGTTTPNAGVEFSLTRHFTLAVEGGYNAWKFRNAMKLNLYFAQPEFRYWFCRKFEGHFWGVHGLYAHFNVGRFPFISSMKDIIYRGDLYGGGISYGYHWVLNPRFSVEAVVGAGYLRMEYDKYRCFDCAERLGQYRRDYFGPTRAAVSLIYFIR